MYRSDRIKMQKKSFILFLAFTLTSGLLFFGCEKLTSASENIATAEGYSLSSSSIIVAINTVEELIEFKGEPEVSKLTILNDLAILKYVDSTLLDGDGLEFTLDYCSLSTIPDGNRGNDGIKRSGVIRVKTEIDPRKAFVVYLEKFITGYAGSWHEMNGQLTVDRLTDKSINLKFANMEIAVNQGASIQKLSGDMSIVTVSGFDTPGFLDNTQDYFGKGTGTLPSGEAYSWTIDENIALTKRFEVGCAKTFIKGLVYITNTESKTNIALDFDPYENKACDKVAKAVIGKREFIFTIK